jgi:hypothetical protein
MCTTIILNPKFGAKVKIFNPIIRYSGEHGISHTLDISLT